MKLYNFECINRFMGICYKIQNIIKKIKNIKDKILKTIFTNFD